MSPRVTNTSRRRQSHACGVAEPLVTIIRWKFLCSATPPKPCDSGCLQPYILESKPGFLSLPLLVRTAYKYFNSLGSATSAIFSLASLNRSRGFCHVRHLYGLQILLTPSAPALLVSNCSTSFCSFRDISQYLTYFTNEFNDWA